MTAPAVHHGSHLDLLTPAIDAGLAQVDAIVVPTARPAHRLREAARLARALECPLLVLCSRQSRALKVHAKLAGDDPLDLTAADVPDTYTSHYLRFDTSGHPASRVGRYTDTSLKRNLGLLVARMVGWDRVVFLDDDVRVPDHKDLLAAAAQLDSNEAVGLKIGGYPDNSVVCHANRETGGFQKTFVGGGALVVRPRAIDAFFPDVYNEDWFFLLNNVRLRRVARVGQALQDEYDPFANPRRARSEEFGDVLAEGVFWLLDHGKRVVDAEERHWREFLSMRRAFIADVRRRVRERGHQRPNAVLTSLEAAAVRLAEITPQMCVQYLRAWRADCTRWRHVLHEVDRLPGVPRLSLADALGVLGLRAIVDPLVVVYADYPDIAVSARAEAAITVESAFS